MARHLTNARNRLTNNDEQIENDMHGTPCPFRKARFHNRICTHRSLTQFF
jgi:hypothetical protein